MIRTVARNEHIFRGTFSRFGNRIAIRTLSIQTVKQCQHLRKLTNLELLKPSRGSLCSINLTRQYSDLPSHIRVALPALSPTMEQGTIVSWEKKEGDKLNEGDLLAEIETDKATMGFETPEEGYLAKIIIPAGSKDIPIGKLLCIIVEDKGDVVAFKDFRDDSSAAFPTPKEVVPEVATAPPPSPTSEQYIDLPSHIRVSLPALSPTMEQGTIVSWEKKEGDKLNEGDLLAEIETDKATMGFETPEEGYLAKILISAGSKDIPIGKLLCIIVEDEGDVAAFKDFRDDNSAVPLKPKVAAPEAASPLAPALTPAFVSLPVTTSPRSMTAVEQKGPRAYASPMAKRLAEIQQLRLEGLGAVTSAVEVSSSAQQQGYVDIPVSNIRGVIAKRLLESKQTIPHYYVTVECQVDNLLKFREQINKKYEKKGVKVSVNDFIIKATAAACRKVPESNSYWLDKTIRQFDNVDVSVAVSTDRGLITPIIFSADRKGVVDISTEVKKLAAKARDNKLLPHEFQGGTVSVSNLGMFGVKHFCAVVNPPQSCILAVGATSKKLIVDSENIIGLREVNVMSVTLSADHRTVDGAVAAKWLQHFQEFIEDPATMNI